MTSDEIAFSIITDNFHTFNVFRFPGFRVFVPSFRKTWLL